MSCHEPDCCGHNRHHQRHPGLLLLSELEADPSSTAAANFAGEHGGRGAVLEYLVDTGAAAPTVEVLITSGGVTANWTDTAIAPGFHVHHFGHLAPGALVTLKVTDASARVRWCETLRY